MVIAASQLQIIDSVGLLDSSRDLQSIHVKNFVNKFYLVLYACVKIFDVIFFVFTGLWEWKLNKAYCVAFGSTEATRSCAALGPKRSRRPTRRRVRQRATSAGHPSPRHKPRSNGTCV